MITKAGDIYCEQGETFTIGFRIVNQDKSPFVLSDAMDDGDKASYLLLTVASSSNITGKNRYLANFWNPTTKYKKFYSTQAVNLNESTWPTVEDLWKTISAMITKDTSIPEDKKDSINPTNYAIYYITLPDGTKEYKHLLITKPGEAASASNCTLEDYFFQFYQYIPKAVSNEWTQSGYDYGLKVVSGTKNAEGSARPIEVEFSYPLIGVHKLFVDSNVQGSISVIDDVDAKEVINE